MTAPFFRIDRFEDIPRAISIFQQSDDTRHRVPILQAFYAGRIAHLEVQRENYATKTKRFLAMVQKPALVLVGDDDGTPTGPAGWPVTERLFRWAHLIILHGAGGHEAHYAGAALAAEVVGKLVFVECGSATIEAWKDAARRWGRNAIIQALQVPVPGVHPIPPRPGDLH